MIQEATDAQVLEHAAATAARHQARAEGDEAVSDLIGAIEILSHALRRHQPVAPAAGWNDAWGRFDREKPSPAEG